MGQDVSFVSRFKSRKFLVGVCLALLGILVVTLIMVRCFRTWKDGGETPSPTSLMGPRVSGGADAPKGRFPYMCSIRKRGSGRHVCGGTQIDNRWVMTAARCLDPRDPNSAGMSPFLYCGIYEREEQDTSKRLIPVRCYLHHLWDGNRLNGNDIALCQLDTSASVAIPQLSDFGDNFTRFDEFSVLGWGSTSSRGSLARVLQIGEGLGYVLPSRCNEVGAWAGSIKNSMMCAGFGYPDTCRGDSGGPLFVQHDPARAIQAGDLLLDLIVGITSFGLPDCEADAPGVYTRISCYRPWIDCIIKKTGQDCSNLDPCVEASSPRPSVEASSPSPGHASSLSHGHASSLCSGVRKGSISDESDSLRRIISAIRSDYSETVNQILCDGLSPNAVYDRYNNSLLIGAAQYNAIKSAKVLLQHGSKIEYKNSYGQTALSRAAAYGSVRALQLLIDSGANIETRNEYGVTPLIYAAKYDHPRIAQMLLQNGANIEDKDNTGWTPLLFAAFFNSTEVAELLIENGADIESKADGGYTPLYIAAQENSINIAKLLIQTGANIESKTDIGWTPLHIAAEKDSIEVAELLIQNGADIESKTDGGYTPLCIAAMYNSIGIAKLLIQSRANVESKDNEQWTSLHFAAYNHSLGVAELLIQNGADIESKTDRRITPLYIAAQENSIDIAKLLIQNGANVESRIDIGWTPLHIAAQKNSLEVARELIAHGANIQSKTNYGDSPLHIAAYHGSLNALRFLLDREAIVDSTNSVGRTPLHDASSCGHILVVRTLLRNGASRTKTDRNGKTPFDVICTARSSDDSCEDDVITTLQELLSA